MRVTLKNKKGFSLTEMVSVLIVGLFAMILVFSTMMNAGNAYMKGKSKIFNELEMRKASKHISTYINKASFVYIKDSPGGEKQDSGVVMELYSREGVPLGTYELID